ncbi:MAG: basic amino acid ABC transporter substrate-binding protein [Thermoleophilia bacterium]|nr:basic amino acid ABC transporter substrate-binding protein [Thermoleophilia bacterium]
MRKWASALAAVAIAATMLFAGCGDDDSSEPADTSGATATSASADLGLKTPGKLLVGSDIPYAPFEFTDAGSTEVKGFDVDLVTAIAATFGVTDVEFKRESFDTIFTTTAQGRFDLAASSITITDERKKVVAFSDPYFEANQSIMVRSDDAKGLDALAGKTITPAEAETALKGMTLGVQRGTTGAELASKVPGAKSQQFQIIDDAFNALLAKRVDAVLNDYAISAYATVAKPNLKVVAKVSPSESYGFAFPKESTALVAAFDEGLAKVKADGTYAEIYRRWFNEEPPAS